MKKLFALLLAAMLALSLFSAAMADAVDPKTWTAKPTNNITFTKVYKVNGPVFPAETLEFEVTADKGNPNPDGKPENTMIVVGEDNKVVVKGQTTKIPVTTPAYTKVGVYKYTVKEKAGKTQGVTYDSKTAINIVVLVTYNYAESKLDVEGGVELVGKDKVDKINNRYSLGGGRDPDDPDDPEDPDDPDDPDNPDDPDDPGDPDGPTGPGTKSLRVKKVVTGNLADTTKYFAIDVTLKASKDVLSDIVISGGSSTSNPKSIKSGWTGSKTVTLYLKDGDTVSFNYVPEGITYSVVEQAKHLEGDINSDEGYTAKYENASGTIKKGKKPVAKVTNDKNVDIKTGIILQYAPYIAILAVVLAGVALMIIRRRRNRNDD